MMKMNSIVKQLGHRSLLLAILLATGFIDLVNIKTLSAAETDSVERLRTLFTTPLERKKLDDLRKTGQFDGKTNQATGQAIIREPLKVEVKGIVFRDKQKPVIWVNDGNTLKSHKIEDGVKVRTSGVKKSKLKVPVRVFQQTLSMKPGQQWSETDPRVQDKYQIKPAKKGTSEAESADQSTDNGSEPN